MKDKFAESEFLVGVPEKLGGAVCMHYDEKAGRGEFLWTHTTSSMGIAFQTTADREATTRMSRLPSTANSHQHRGGTSILVRLLEPFFWLLYFTFKCGIDKTCYSNEKKVFY